MRKSFLFSFFCFLSFFLFSQELPFGVVGLKYWLEAKQEGGQIVLFEKNSEKKILEKPLSKGKKTNHQWSFPLEVMEKISLPMSEEQAQRYSIFIVYEEENSSIEQNLWSLSNPEEESLIIVTNRRLADYTGEQYRSYSERINSEKVKIHYYQHYKNFQVGAENSQFKSQNYHLNLGEKISTIPTQGFIGNISEVLFYDRVLSVKEMQQVSSYLAMKYGVSLHQHHYKNYYNPDGEEIWDYENHREYNQNITGLGKFIQGNLSQKQSKNSNDEQVVGMSFSDKKAHDILDNTAVFWSDNGGELMLKKQKEGQPKGIGRVWQLDLANDKATPLNWYFNPRAIERAKSESNDYYWLVSDLSSKGNFAPEHSIYVKLNKIENNKTTEVQDILSVIQSWATSKNQALFSKNLHYTIWAAPEMFAHLEIEQGKCQSHELGKIQFNIVGGEAPYQIRVKSEEGRLADQVWEETKNKGERELKLPSGRYIYEIKDRQNRIYREELYLTNADSPMPEIRAEYVLGKELVVLDMEEMLPRGEYQYEWYQDERLISQSSLFLLSQSGDYILRIRSVEGCHWEVRFKVSNSEFDFSETKIALYPNPSTDGYFRLMANFPKTTSGILSIYDMGGRLVQKRSFYHQNTWDYEGQLNLTGVYILHLKTTLGEHTYKLKVN